jgi:cysteine desulfurase/selenocysteine lyase
MIRRSPQDQIIYNDAPMKFEAGTPGIVQTIGLELWRLNMMGLGGWTTSPP